MKIGGGGIRVGVRQNLSHRCAIKIIRILLPQLKCSQCMRLWTHENMEAMFGPYHQQFVDLQTEPHLEVNGEKKALCVIFVWRL